VNIAEAKAILEALIFAAPEPITLRDCARILGISERTAALLIRQLDDDYAARQSALTIRQVAKGYQICTKPEYAEYIRAIGRTSRSQNLSPAALECLAIVAYKQPITRVEIDEIRGVRSDSALQSLIERELVMEVGRKEAIGRPILFGTTNRFLEVFGLKDLAELPPLEENQQILLE